MINGISIPLYETFDSQETAIDGIKSNRLICEIKSIYKYDTISDANWRLYYEAMFELLDSDSCPSWYRESCDEYRKLSSFFDIYENYEKNEEIINAVNGREVGEVLNDKLLLTLLPYDSFSKIQSSTNTFESKKIVLKSNVKGFDTKKGIKYADKYANVPNRTDYKVFGKDCTNFASQILENGGVSQQKYKSEYRGWWHIKKRSGLIYTHQQSVSWMRADTFAKYMGVTYTTTSNKQFSKNIQPGDFIAADFDKDGDWDHIGFVTNKVRKNGYYDYKVAQHTSNYHDWTSSKKNSWEKVGKNGGKYGRVRR